MADPKETVYEADPHTRAKHQILQEYLKRWLPILAQQSQKLRRNQRLLYVDGFAGAGEYSDNIPGSPIVAIQTALKSASTFTVPVRIKLVEIRADRVANLSKLVGQLRPELARSGRIGVDDPIQGDCETVINQLIDEHEQRGQGLGPALFFLDQFGYSSFSMALIGRILKNDVCEVFSYLNWNMLNPFMADATKHTGISKAFGGDEWMAVLGLSGKAREDRFRDIYLEALRSRAGANFSYPFAMRDQNERVIYWLFFCSNNIRGLEEMKKAMWSVDRSGGFEFSDKHANSFGKLFRYGDDELGRDLFNAFDAQTLTVGEVEKYVFVSTPACIYKRALGNLERTGRLEVVDPPAGRRQGAFNEASMRVRFGQTIKPADLTLFDR